MGDIVSTNWYIYRVYAAKLEAEPENDCAKKAGRKIKKKE